MSLPMYIGYTLMSISAWILVSNLIRKTAKNSSEQDINSEMEVYNWSACDDHQTVDDEKCSDDTQSGIDCYEPLSYRYVVPLPQYYGRVRQRKKLKRFSIRRLISGYAIKYNKKPYSYASAKCDDDSIHSEDEYMSVKSHFSDTQVVGEIDTVVDDVDGMSCRAQFEEGNATAVELNGYDNVARARSGAHNFGSATSSGEVSEKRNGSMASKIGSLADMVSAETGHSRREYRLECLTDAEKNRVEGNAVRAAESLLRLWVDSEDSQETVECILEQYGALLKDLVDDQLVRGATS